MRRKIPGTELLIAFDSVAKHMSISRAADELALTASAVSRQIGALEAFLGIHLFIRTTRQIHLTDAGANYAKQVHMHLRQMEHDTLSLMAHRGAGGILELAVIPTFATKWLIPRLRRFNEQHPEIIVDLTTRAEPFLFIDTPFHAAIHFGAPIWPGATTEFLFGEELVPICHPSWLNNQQPLSAQEIATLPLLHQSSRQDAWRKWFSACGMHNFNAMGGARYELFSMLVEAVRSKIGIALVPKFFVIDDIEAGTLAIANATSLLNQGAYYLVYPEDKEANLPLIKFQQWLLEEALAYREQAPIPPLAEQ